MGFACSGASTAGVAVLRGCAGRAPSALPARFGSSREGGAYILRQPFSIASATPCRYSGVVPGDACVSPVFVVSQLHFCASDPTSPQCLDPCSHPCRHSSVVFGRSRLRAWRVHSRASGRLLRRLRAPPLNCTRIPAPCLVTHAYEDSGFTPLFWVAFSSPGLRPCHPRRTERLRRAATIASACASGRLISRRMVRPRIGSTSALMSSAAVPSAVSARLFTFPDSAAAADRSLLAPPYRCCASSVLRPRTSLARRLSLAAAASLTSCIVSHYPPPPVSLSPSFRDARHPRFLALLQHASDPLFHPSVPPGPAIRRPDGLPRVSFCA